MNRNRDIFQLMRDVAITVATVVWTASLVVTTHAVDPVKQGQNDAKRDIAYDSIMSEWISDCDCTSDLDE